MVNSPHVPYAGEKRELSLIDYNAADAPEAFFESLRQSSKCASKSGFK